MNITKDQWLQICGLLGMYRESAKKNEEIYEHIKRIAPGLEDYVTDEGYEDTSFEQLEEDWKKHPIIKLCITENLVVEPPKK